LNGTQEAWKHWISSPAGVGTAILIAFYTCLASAGVLLATESILVNSMGAEAIIGSTVIAAAAWVAQILTLNSMVNERLAGMAAYKPPIESIRDVITRGLVLGAPLVYTLQICREFAFFAWGAYLASQFLLFKISRKAAP
jgi:Na+-transporting NADH:ubiquinone oxidoreductase subunit NqrD